MVEDNDGVREYARDILVELGYRDLMLKCSGSVACRGHKATVSLLFTDVVLGNSNGRYWLTNSSASILGSQCCTRLAIRATQSCIRDASMRKCIS